MSLIKKRNALGDSSLSVVRYNSDVGKHGDTGRSKFDILEAIKGRRIRCRKYWF